MSHDNLVWNRLYREGSSGFTFLEALRAVRLQCEDSLRLDAREGFEASELITRYKAVLEQAASDYAREVETARQAAEAALIKKWLASDDEELTRIAEILRDGAYDQLVF